MNEESWERMKWRERTEDGREGGEGESSSSPSTNNSSQTQCTLCDRELKPLSPGDKRELGDNWNTREPSSKLRHTAERQDGEGLIRTGGERCEPTSGEPCGAQYHLGAFILRDVSWSFFLSIRLVLRSGY